MPTSDGIYAKSLIDGEVVLIDAATGQHTVLLDKEVDDLCVIDGWVVYREDRESTTLRMVRADGTADHEVDLGG